MLFSMLVKLSEDCKSYGERNYSYGWDEHKREREYFECRLKELEQIVDSQDGGKGEG